MRKRTLEEALKANSENTQDILDELCRKEIEEEIEDLKVQNQNLQLQLCMDNLRESQAALTAKSLDDIRKPVSRNWIDVVLNVLIVAGVIFMLWFGCFVMTASANEPSNANGHIAGVNKQLAKTIRVAEKRYEKKVRAEKRRQKRLAKKRRAEKEKQKQLEAQYEIIFGYVPTADEISLIKHVAMHESGNTEPHEGIVALIACIANRARLRDGRFPNTVVGVAYQSGQMTCVTDGSIWNYTVNDRVEAAWQDFISGGYARHPRIVSWTAGYYNPYFEEAYPIGNHFFGY